MGGEQNTAANQMAKPQVRISYDEMEAYITMPLLPMDKNHTTADILAALEKNNVRYGVIQDTLISMVKKRLYGREILIAKGEPVVNGTDGYFDFNFDTDFSKKPKVNEDGTVDYWSIHAVEVVEEGQVIAIYNPPVAGKNGMTVTGKQLIAKMGRNLPPLSGKGFDRSEDNMVYTANISGKIEYVNKRIMITGVYEVFGNVDVQVGNIDFRGDVIIHGNVTTGATISTTGSITIDGTAEGCTLQAGRDIILRGGMIGGDKAMIKAKGNIFAKFIEYSTVEAEGFIQADSAMNSTIISYDRIFFNGSHASVVGGSIFGCGGIEANNFGNSSEIKTEICAGVHRKLLERVLTLQEQADEIESLINKINAGIEQFDEMTRLRNRDMKNDERRVSLLRARIAKKAELATVSEELNRINQILARSKGATIKVLHDVYPGVQIAIDDCKVNVKEKQKCIEFRLRRGSIIMESML